MIELLRAKEDIYWENPCDGEKPFCTKGNWYKVIKWAGDTIVFENDLGIFHHWNINEVNEDFFTIDFEKGFEAINANNSKLVFKNNKFDNITQEFYGHTVPAISKELYKTFILDGEFTVTKYSNEDYPYENWKMSISKDKFVRCITPLVDEGIIVEGIYGYVDKVHNKLYYNVYDGMDKFIVADVYATDRGYEFVRENKDSGKVSGMEENNDLMDAVAATREGILASFGLPTDTPTYNPVKNISRNKFLRCVDMCKEKVVFNNLDGSNTYWMDKSPCGKYYYWDKHNRKNEIIYFRGEVDWVEKNYRKDNPDQRKRLADIVDSLRDYYDEKDPVIVAEENNEDYWDRVKSSGSINASLDNQDQKKTEWTDKHYDFNYTLTEDDIENGVIKIDPYFVNRMWKINSWDDTGAAFHCLKNYARMSNRKNPLERDLTSLYKQVKRLCDLHGVKL